MTSTYENSNTDSKAWADYIQVVNTGEVCYFCEGLGEVPPSNPDAICTSCHGSGWVWDA